MEIGTKIKNARISTRLTQEQSAEALGVSRQTISNWENNKSYPDIISVIKMSDLYSVTLDHLLKEEVKMSKQTYTDFLEESTNIVKSKNKLGKTILITAYLIIWTLCHIALWFFASETNANELNKILLWTLFPVTTFVVSFFITKNNYVESKKWLVAIFFGAMFMLIPFVNSSIADGIIHYSFCWPNFLALPIGIILSLCGLALGSYRKK